MSGRARAAGVGRGLVELLQETTESFLQEAKEPGRTLTREVLRCVAIIIDVLHCLSDVAPSLARQTYCSSSEREYEDILLPFSAC